MNALPSPGSREQGCFLCSCLLTTTTTNDSGVRRQHRVGLVLILSSSIPRISSQSSMSDQAPPQRAPEADQAQAGVDHPEQQRQQQNGGGQSKAGAAYAIRTGPMLRYDTTEPEADFLYHAFALIITADKHSDASHTPTLRYHTPQGEERTVKALRIFQYDGHTFWRFKIELNLGNEAAKITYELTSARFLHADIEAVIEEELEGNEQPDDAHKKNATNSFYVPAKDQSFRWASHSCNGFSDTIDTSEWGGADPLWWTSWGNMRRTPSTP